MGAWLWQGKFLEIDFIESEVRLSSVAGADTTFACAWS
jgi:hypothetical protein